MHECRKASRNYTSVGEACCFAIPSLLAPLTAWLRARCLLECTSSSMGWVRAAAASWCARCRKHKLTDPLSARRRAVPTLPDVVVTSEDHERRAIRGSGICDLDVSRAGRWAQGRMHGVAWACALHCSLRCLRHILHATVIASLPTFRFTSAAGARVYIHEGPAWLEQGEEVNVRPDGDSGVAA